VNSQFLRFLATGGFAALVNLACRYLLNKFMSFEAAVALAYLVGMTVAYVLARLFVFEASGRSRAAEFQRFALVNVFSLVLVWSISVGLAKFLFPAIGFTWHAEDVAHFIGVAAPAAASFVAHKFYTFSKVESEASL
jgi:putative flippase GtrA